MSLDKIRSAVRAAGLSVPAVGALAFAEDAYSECIGGCKDSCSSCSSGCTTCNSSASACNKAAKEIIIVPVPL